MFKYIVYLVLLVGPITFYNAKARSDSPSAVIEDKINAQLSLFKAREAGFRQGCRYALLAIHKEAHKVSFEELQATCTDLLKFIKMDANAYKERIAKTARSKGGK